jgi:hypothetical protein
MLGRTLAAVLAVTLLGPGLLQVAGVRADACDCQKAACCHQRPESAAPPRSCHGSRPDTAAALRCNHRVDPLQQPAVAGLLPRPIVTAPAASVCFDVVTLPDAPSDGFQQHEAPPPRPLRTT